jgi:hypothetical protein
MVPNLTTQCAGCLRPAKTLLPFCPLNAYRNPRWAFPKYCDRCIKEERTRKKHAAKNLTAQQWAERQTEERTWQAYREHAFAEAHRGMIRTEPFPPQGRHRSFVWELKPSRTLVTEYVQMPRYVKTNWS